MGVGKERKINMGGYKCNSNKGRKERKGRGDGDLVYI